MGSNHSRFGCVHAPLDEDQRQLHHPRPTVTNNKSRREISLSPDSMTHSSGGSTPPPPSQSISISDDSDIEMDYAHYLQSNIKILFLDVDGVLNRYGATLWDEDHNGIEDDLLRYLKLILLKTGAKIVLSTTWRLNERAKQILLHSFKTRADINIDDVVIGQTVSLKAKGLHRTHEIMHFLQSHRHRFNVLSWCALDDLPLNEYDSESQRVMMGHFVRTNPKVGISPNNALSCIEILNECDSEYNPYSYSHSQLQYRRHLQSYA
mmetsp:Transcript_24250/g.39013  ORF Transcript_24250/g.39013 Transcript_24250/m.39013 type:complete len:264 (+) Transcript_24250:122-913(+)|eukprot:CAMPEP_0202702670 /NCGR_PEP_ID=MMETSP1385-20130828/15616_1 /ASSEMBLY_ACC=CAM_ASM_000861 /TAXON_ID=933848 /ORGANISM="Elphidium margaritaceum" /LENGTH=263 /DNA_ID=CAMNT_0049360357 /DNA_START=101 /DNA_END=892 /DNA_ORIENTATION=+